MAHAAVRDRRQQRQGRAGPAVPIDGPVWPPEGRAADTNPLHGRRGVPIQPARGPVRDAQRGQKTRYRQRPAVRGAQVLQAAAGAADQPAVRPGGQPRPVQQHVVLVGELTRLPRYI